MLISPLMPSEPPIHSKLLAAAARDILRPMGLFQKGESRTWLDDHGWWMCVVEFQPSSWSRGSYLNVGCMWLWLEKDYIAFNEANRLGSFCRFENQRQFEIEASRLAKRAAQEVERYRLLFPNINSVCDFCLKRPAMPEHHWQTFDAGVACAIAGRPSDAVRFLDRFLTPMVDRPKWLIAAQSDAQKLKELAPNTIEFRELVANRIRRTRELQKLPALADVDFDGAARL